jgi:hypothetical protein
VSEAIDFIVKLTEPYSHLFEPLLLIKLVWVQVWASESLLLRKHLSY